ncbi:MAG: hypothetical protein A2041_06875 [Bacteroidetes bacterium GWA2_31_9b]|nr:MAG: hypothetical protein A2041_06875 [Bacteroidetes bacterium GWA2_31_9b]
MRIKENIFFICVVLYCCLLSNIELKAQSSISVGFGIPDYINAGYRYHKEQMGFGLSIGALPTSNENIFTGRAGFLYHFYGKRVYSLIKPWYINPGIAYNSVNFNSHFDQYLMIDMRIGREFSLNHFWGIYSEIGLFYIFWKDVQEKDFSFAFDYNSPIIPSVNIGIYYRFPEGCNCPKPRKH